MPGRTETSDAVFRMAITEPTAIDPYRAQEIEGIGVTKQLFTGLLRVDREHGVAPAVASSWECDEAGRVWIFHLRENLSFSNGEPLDASSFVRGVNRALDPAANTETAYHLAGVRGFDAMRSGAVDTLSGLSAPDPHTLVFALEQVDFEFDKKTVQPVFSPVPAVAGTALNPAFNDMPIGNGPYMMAEPWQHGSSIRLVRNPRWFGERPRVAEIHIDILSEGDSLEREYAGFLDGRYDFARVPGESVTKARELFGDGGFLERDLPGLHYLIPFCHQAPMGTRAARRAISAAIDRAGIAERLFSGTRVPADALLSPWFEGVHTPGLGGGYTRYDPELARECARQAGLTPGSVIDLAVNTGAGHDGWVAAVAEQISRVLEVEVRLLAMSATQLLAHRTSQTAAGLCRAGWAYDYPTPDNLLFPLLHSSCTSPDADGTAHGDNEGRYVNTEFDRALLSARAAADQAERVRWWQSAERLAMDDMALIPLWFRTEYRVFAADAFTAMDLDFFGNPTLADLRPVESAN